MPAERWLDVRIREREGRRDLILASARRLFAERDFRSVTVREIAGEAGLSPAAIYRYYANLDELFLDVFVAGAQEITGRIERETRKKGGCSLRRLCRLYILFINRKPRRIPLKIGGSSTAF